MSQDAINVDAIAGAVASAIRQSLNSSIPPQQGSGVNASPSQAGAGSSSSQHGATSVQPPTTYDRASDLTNSSSKRPRFAPPTLFENMRNRRGRNRGQKAAPKITCYVRDVVLLPTDFRNRYGEVIVPRRKKTSLLARDCSIHKPHPRLCTCIQLHVCSSMLSFSSVEGMISIW